jgi:transposase-like protein
MQNITKWPFAQLGHTLVLLSLLTLALLGQVPDSQAGWLTCPPRMPAAPAAFLRRHRPTARLRLGERLRCCGHYLAASWPGPLARVGLLGLLWLQSGCQWPVWLVLWPLFGWLWQAVAVGWPALHRRAGWRAGAGLLWHGQRLLVVLALSRALTAPGAPWRAFAPGPPRQGALFLLPLGLGCTMGGPETPRVEVTRREDGRYRAELCGHFTLELPDDDLFRRRMLLLFLRQLQVPGDHRGSRRTRDGRTPFVRQVQLQEWFGLPHPDISRLERDWLRGDWANLLSQRLPAEVLTADLRDRIVTVCATLFPHHPQEVYQHLQQQGVQVSQRQVRQAWEQSGWSKLHQELQRRYHWTPAAFQLREDFLVQELLRLTQLLLECLEQGQPLPPTEQLALADLRALAHQLGSAPPPPVPARPWLLRVQRVLFGTWETVTDATIRCPQCGSPEVGRKSRKPRMKKFRDEHQQLQEVAVYRYYCRNPACPVKTFTHLPLGLVPYSRYRLELHTLVLQAYEWSASRYRRVGQSLAISQVTVYRWVRAWGQQLLPVAALFGLVRSSGVIGVDEKYVLVPKNDKPASKMKRWMYVYLAVDVYTYDLLHIALYPHNSPASAQAFLVALRAKGYRPRVIVTDLRRDYGAVIAQVFAQARHHECIFHAEKEIGDSFRHTWGRNYAETHPEAAQLLAAVTRIFWARTKRTAQKRYAALREQREHYVQASPGLQWVFDFLEKHWPHLVDAVESELIPRTNNAVEIVIGRFDQHYQNFRGFESQQTAQVYLGVFEKVYRFTPFSNDAQPEIRGKCPLELAGYDLRQMPMLWLGRGYSLEWPIVEEGGQDVPSV